VGDVGALDRSLVGASGSSDLTGQGIDNLTGKLLQMAGAIASALALKKLVTTGIEYNETIAKSEIGIATLISSFYQVTDAQGNVLKGQEAFNVAQDEAAKVMEKLEIANFETAAELGTLVQAFQAAITPASALGMSLDQVQEITVGVTQAMTSMGKPLYQLRGEIQQLLEGRINPTISPTALAIVQLKDGTVEAYKAAMKAGTAYEYLKERLDTVEIGGRAAADTLGVSWSNVMDVIGKTVGNLTKETFVEIVKGLHGIQDSIMEVDQATGKLKLSESFSEAAQSLGELTKTTMEAVKWAIDFYKEHYEGINTIVSLTVKVGGLIAVYASLSKIISITKKSYIELHAISSASWYAQNIKGLKDMIQWLGVGNGIAGYFKTATGFAGKFSAALTAGIPIMAAATAAGFALSKSLEALIDGSARAYEKQRALEDAAINADAAIRLQSKLIAEGLQVYDKLNKQWVGIGKGLTLTNEAAAEFYSILKSNRSEAEGFLEWLDKTVKVQDLGRLSLGELKDLMQAYRDETGKATSGVEGLNSAHEQFTEEIVKSTTPALEDLISAHKYLVQQAEKAAEMEKQLSDAMDDAFTLITAKGKNFAEVFEVAQAVIGYTAQKTQKSTKEMSDGMQQFSQLTEETFQHLFDDVLSGNFEGLDALADDVFDSIATMFANMWTKMVTDAITGQKTISQSMKDMGQFGQYGMAFSGGSLFGQILGGSGIGGGVGGLAGQGISDLLGSTGPWGAIIGSVLGSVLEQIFSGTQAAIAKIRYQGGVFVVDAEEEIASEAEKQMQYLLDQTVGTILDSYQDVFSDLGVQWDDVLGEMGANMRQALLDSVFKTNGTGNVWWKIEKDDSDEVAKRFQQFLSGELEAIYFDLIDGILGTAISSWGVADAKIDQLMGYWSSLPGEKIRESIAGYVEVLTGLTDALDILSMNSEQLTAHVQDVSNVSFEEYFQSIFDKFVLLGQQIQDAVSIDFQIEKGQQLYSLWQSYYQTQITYMNQLLSIQNQISSSAASQREQLERLGLTSEQLIARDFSQINDLLDALYATADPTEAASLFQQIQSLISDILSQSGENSTAYQSQLLSILGEAEAQAKDVTQGLIDSIVQDNAAIYDEVFGALGDFKDVIEDLIGGGYGSGGFTDLGDSTGVLKGDFDALDDEVTQVTSAFRGLYESMTGIASPGGKGKSIDSFQASMIGGRTWSSPPPMNVPNYQQIIVKPPPINVEVKEGEVKVNVQHQFNMDLCMEAILDLAENRMVNVARDNPDIFVKEM